MTNYKKESIGSNLRVRVTEMKKADSGLLVTNAMLPEDEFIGAYFDGAKGDYLEPPYNFGLLEKLVEENNSLSPCISAYEVNIDGSGHVLEKGGVEISRADNDPVANNLFDYLDEISPGVSIVALRKDMRRTLETTGNAFIEVVRNIQGEIVFLNLLPTNMMRLVKLGAPITVTKTMMRFGKPTEVVMLVRERSFVQKAGTRYIYFKEFGASRDIARDSGQWSDTKLPMGAGGNEVIHIIVYKAANSSYGVPRWISQSPSVVGSRGAEELNLDFFKSGGIPPAIVFIAGGFMGEAVRKQLENIFNAPAHKSVRGAVVEVQPSGGSIDKENKPEITVERFGESSKSDSMFEEYDGKCEQRVRKAFRLPPLFVGLAEDYTYASVYASYLVAEAQVFSPERDEFDTMFNATIMKALDPTGTYVFRSKKISIKDADTQLKGITLLKGLVGVDEKGMVDAVNEVTSLNLNYDPEIADEDKSFKRDLLVQAIKNPAPVAKPGAKPVGKVVGAKKFEKQYQDRISALVDKFAIVSGIIEGELTDTTTFDVMTEVAMLDKVDKEIFDSMFTLVAFPGAYHDMKAAREMCSCLLDHKVIPDVQ